jgi:hypothetical protein
MVVNEAGVEKVTDVNPVQSSNAFPPIEVTEIGMFIETNLLHPLKALRPIVANKEGVEKVTEVNPVQFSNKPSPIEVTEIGIFTEANLEQL